MKKMGTLLLLHICILFFSFGGIFSKIAAGYPLFSLKFFLCYFAILLILFLYAVFWQQILKRLDLTTAYSNKSMTVVWGMIWGALFFHEIISVKELLGALLIIIGIYLVAQEEKV